MDTVPSDATYRMSVLNNIDRFQLAFDAIRRIERLHPIVARERNRLADSHQRHRAFVVQYGEDMPEVQNWKWNL